MRQVFVSPSAIVPVAKSSPPLVQSPLNIETGPDISAPKLVSMLLIKLSYNFANHMEKNHKLAMTDETISNYLALPLDSGIFKVLKAKYMFFLFYI